MIEWSMIRREKGQKNGTSEEDRENEFFVQTNLAHVYQWDFLI